MEQAIQKISELVSQLKTTQVQSAQEQVVVDMSIVEEVNVTSSIEQMNADIASLEAEIEFLDAEEVSEEDEGDCGMLATNLFVFNQDGSASLEDMKRKRKRKRSSMEEMKRKREVLKRKRMLEDAVEVLKRKREVLKRKREVLKRKREVQKRGNMDKVLEYSTDVPTLNVPTLNVPTLKKIVNDVVADVVAVAASQAIGGSEAETYKHAIAGVKKAIADAGLYSGSKQFYDSKTTSDAYLIAYKSTIEELEAKNLINSRKARDVMAATAAKVASDDNLVSNQNRVKYQKDQLYKGQNTDRLKFVNANVREVKDWATVIESKHDERERVQTNSKILKALAQ